MLAHALPRRSLLVAVAAPVDSKVLMRSKLTTPEPKAVICYGERFDCSQYFEAAEGAGLQVRHVPSDSLHPDYQDPGRIHFLLTTLRYHDTFDIVQHARFVPNGLLLSPNLSDQIKV